MDRLILGIDEVGRGSLAGPLYVGACVLRSRDSEKEKSWQSQLTDSKRLTKSRREELAKEIESRAVSVGLGSVEPEEIDELGLSIALKTATRLAAANLIKNTLDNPPNIPSADTFSSQQQFSSAFLDSLINYPLPFDEIIIDGPQNFLQGTFLENYVTNLNKADLLIKEVSAASIIAKVFRDRLMADYATEYPVYGFERNVGYGTKAHLEALNRFGPCPLHRFSYSPVKKSFQKIGVDSKYFDELIFRNYPKTPARPKSPATKVFGDRAEEVVADYLQESGHKILARNLRTHDFEIDIISKKSGRIYFTEVKYRKNGNPLDAIDPKKYTKMVQSADAVMAFLTEKLDCSVDNLPAPILAVASVSGHDFHLDQWFPLLS
ncbi:MAG: ribonuclease HII [Candidatus Saccharibacteria bacterium]|nr:ribonuclease HII [Candidatus Saccharibacteria bacterium]